MLFVILAYTRNCVSKVSAVVHCLVNIAKGRQLGIHVCTPFVGSNCGAKTGDVQCVLATVGIMSANQLDVASLP